MDSNLIDDRARGAYRKFFVKRIDGSSDVGGKHERCEFFVLDLMHDPFAYEALRAYSLVCRHEYPQLADSIVTKLMEMRHRERQTRDVNGK